MSDYSDDYDDENEDAPADGPKALRDQLKKKAASEKALQKELADLKTALAEASKVSRAASLKDVLTAAGGDAAAKLVRFYPADAETTAEAVKTWLTENQDVFNLSGTTTNSQQTQADSTDSTTEGQTVDPAVQAYLDARERAADLERDSVTVPGDEQLVAEMHRLASEAKTMQDLSDGLRKLGAPVANTGYRR